MARRTLKQLYKSEFSDYNRSKFRQDLLAGLTVTAVALPLALAFGVASGATAAAGLVTAILAGIVIGALSGAPYQISGPTGAMSAVLILLVSRYGLEGVWVAGLLSGIFLLIIGLLKLGRFIAFIPSAVITGFTSGIALIIAIGQIDNFLGVTTPGTEAAIYKFVAYFKGGFSPDWRAVLLGLIVIGTMIIWPKKLNARFPASLLGIIVATAVTIGLGWQVPQIGEIPQTVLLAERLNLMQFDWTTLPEFITPALTITALGAVESLLCGAVAANMTGVRLQANQELIGQGLGNMLIPFFGGVPATAAIARTSVGIKAGGQTRLVSIISSIGLLISMFFLAPVMARIPLSALAGVLIMTAWRMNEWSAMRFMLKKRFKTDILAFSITMIATITLDLTQAILIGSFVVGAVFLNRIANLEVEVVDVDAGKLREKGFELDGKCPHVKVAFVTGPLFFAATGIFNESLSTLNNTAVIILSMRGMPLIDTAGIEAIYRLYENLRERSGTLMLTGVHSNVRKMLERSGLLMEIGEENVFWSSDQAIVAAEKRGCRLCASETVAAD